MSDKIEKEIKKMKKKLYEYSSTAIKLTAKELNFQIEKDWEKSIEKFYDSYTPSFYNRTYSLYKASSLFEDVYSLPVKSVKWNKVKELNKKLINYTVLAGLEVDYKNIGNNPYNAKDLEWVFNRSYEKGIHGYTEGEAELWNLRLKQNIFLYKKEQKECIPTPQEMMRNQFKKYTINYIYKIYEKKIQLILKNIKKGK